MGDAPFVACSARDIRPISNAAPECGHHVFEFVKIAFVDGKEDAIALVADRGCFVCSANSHRRKNSPARKIAVSPFADTTSTWPRPTR